MPATKRSRNPRGQGALLRESLIQATVQAISDAGDLSKVSVREITRRAGVSPTAMYLHFADRYEVLDAAIDSGFAAFNAAVAGAASRQDDPRARLLAMGRAYVAFAEEHPALYAVIFSARRELTGDHSNLAARMAGFDRLAEEAAAAGADAPQEVAGAIWAALHGFVTLRQNGMTKTFASSERYLERILDAFLP